MRTTLLSIFLLPIFLQSNLLPHFNPATIHDFKGKVLSVQSFEHVTEPAPHKQILLRTASGKLTVDLGPEWYLDSQGITVYPGEEVEIKGSLIEVDGTHFIIASSITQGNTTYKLREKNGLPIWRGQ